MGNLQPKLDMTTGAMPSAEEREYARSPNAIKWTRADCAKLEAEGILTRNYELVEGDIIYKMPQKTVHRNYVNRAANWLNSVFGADYVQSQVAIDVTIRQAHRSQTRYYSTVRAPIRTPTTQAQTKSPCVSRSAIRRYLTIQR